MSLIRYFATDRYAVYIWGSYGVTFLLLAAEVLMLLKRKRNLARRHSPKLESRDARLETSFQEIQ
jgi:heme exporter protein CcmD